MSGEEGKEIFSAGWRGGEKGKNGRVWRLFGVLGGGGGEKRGGGCVSAGSEKEGRDGRGKESKRKRFPGRAVCFPGVAIIRSAWGRCGEEKDKEKQGAGENGKRARPFSFLGAD